MNRLAKSKTRKGGLGKNEHPDGLTTFKGNSGKNRGIWENYSPVDRKPERAIQAKMGWWKRKNEWKRREKNKHAKSIDHRCDVQSTYVAVPTSSGTIQTVFLYSCYSFLPSAKASNVSSSNSIPRRGTFAYVSEREPLRAQYSNVLSAAAKLCLQIANHHAFQSIHTCIIMHPRCSCIW